jgi:hypothetical protein
MSRRRAIAETGCEKLDFSDDYQEIHPSVAKANVF